MFGRADEAEQLAALLDAVARGQGGAVLVEGEAGIGKTTLVLHAVEAARDRGVRVLLGRAEDLGGAGAFAPVLEALGERLPARPSSGQDTDIVFSRTGISEELFRLLQHLVARIEDAAARGPVLLVLEDLHWADEATLLVVRTLARRLRQLPLAVALTYRSWPEPPRWAATVAHYLDAGAVHLPLPPLDRCEVRQLVLHRGGPAVLRRLEPQLDAAGGNPFFVEQLVHLAARSPGQDPPGAPGTVQLAVLHRLSALPDDTRHALRWAAVLGRDLRVPVLSAVLEVPASRVLELLDPALAAGVLGQCGGRLVFRHDLLRQAVYEAVPAVQRSTLHLEAARALVALDADPEHVAAHYELGAQPGDEDAPHWLAVAAQHAMEVAPARAAGLLQRAVDLTERGDTVALQARLAAARVWAGDAEGGEALALRLLHHHVDRELRADLALVLAHALGLQGRMPDSVEALAAVLDDPELPVEARSRLLAHVAMGRLLAGQFDQARAQARAALELGERSGTDAAVCLALTALSWCHYSVGDLEPALRLGQQAVLRADASATVEARRHHPRMFLGMVLLGADRFDEAEAVLQRGLAQGRALGSLWDLPVYQCGLALRRFYAGEWDDAAAEAHTGVAVADEFVVSQGRSFLHSVLARIAVHRGQVQLADETVAASEREFASSPMRFGVDQVLLARAVVQEAQGSPDQALATLTAAWDVHTALRMNTQYRLAPALVRLAVASGDLDRARAVTEDVATAATRTATPSAEGVALRCRGLVVDDPDVLRSAVAAYRSGPRPFETAGAAEDAAACLLRHGRLEQARLLLADAQAGYRSVGAEWDLRRLAELSRTAGVSVPPARRCRPTTGWESLTRSESAVVGLVSDGLSNPEVAARLCISRRTVETHLSSVFRKLDLPSRTALAAAAARRTAGTRESAVG